MERLTACRFYSWLLLSQILALAALILIFVWNVHYEGGLSLTGAGQLMNLHTVLMVIGFVFLYGEALLVYRVFPNVTKPRVKLLHALLLFLAFIFAILGMTAINVSKNQVKSAHLRSLHSWVGLATAILFGLQWLCGFISFVFPGVGRMRALYKPVHVFWGLTVFAGAITAVLLGILQRSGGDDFTPARQIALSLAVITAGMGIVITYIVTRPEYARQDVSEDEHMRLTQ